MLSDSPLLTSAASMLQRLELSDSSIALPLVVFGIHSLLALLGGLLLSLLLRCRRMAVSKYRLFASVMRMQKEMQPTTIISAAALTVASLVQPVQGELRLALILSAVAFALVGYSVYFVAFVRFHLLKHLSQRDALLDNNVSIDADDVAACFYLNRVFSTTSILVLRRLMLASVLFAMGLASASSIHPPYRVLVSNVLLFVLVLFAGNNFMRPAIATARFPHWDQKDFQRALQQRRSSGGGPGSSPSKPDPASALEEPSSTSSGWCGDVRGVLSFLFLSASREVVLRESTKLAWTDHRFNNIGELAVAPSAAHGMDAVDEQV